MSSRLLGPKLVMIHDVEHGDYSAVTSAMGMEGHFSLTSYTDTHPAINSHSLNLKLDVFFADLVVVQEALVSARTYLAEMALRPFKYSPPNKLEEKLRYFNNDYEVRTFNETDLEEFFVDLNDFRKGVE